MSKAIKALADENAALRAEVRKWVDNKRRSDVRAEALQAEVEQLKKVNRNIIDVALREYQEVAARAKAAEAKVEALQFHLEQLGYPLASVKALAVGEAQPCGHAWHSFPAPNSWGTSCPACQALAAGEAQLEICDACNGSGEGVADTVCGKCNGSGGMKP